MPVKISIVAPEFDMNTIPRVEIEIPDVCPHCGADLTYPGTTIREAGFVWYSSPAYIAKANPRNKGSEDELECDGFEESFDETTLHTSYTCNRCDGDLTTPKVG